MLQANDSGLEISARQRLQLVIYGNKAIGNGQRFG